MKGDIHNLSIVQFQASLQLIEPGNVEKCSQKNDREDVEHAGVSQNSEIDQSGIFSDFYANLTFQPVEGE